jgi:hypothetical protein
MMPEKTLAEPVHRRPNPQAMGASHVEFDLETELALLQQEPEWQTGHNSKTLVTEAFGTTSRRSKTVHFF